VKRQSYTTSLLVDNWKPGAEKWTGYFRVALPGRRALKTRVEIDTVARHIVMSYVEYLTSAGEVKGSETGLSLNDRDIYESRAGDAIVKWLERHPRFGWT
jgi:hypothetical protein